MNQDPKNPFFMKLDKNISELVEKHFNVDRRWRYNLEEARWKTFDELIERREESKHDDVIIKMKDVDDSVI
jgi:hypothetical protein